MPTYEYLCTGCSNEWEAEQSIREPALTDCPACSRATARRQISRGTGFILKGGGWYSDLYSSNNAAAKTDRDGAATAQTSGTDAKADGAKAETNAETKTTKTDAKADTTPKGSATAAA